MAHPGLRHLDELRRPFGDDGCNHGSGFAKSCSWPLDESLRAYDIRYGKGDKTHAE